MGTFKNKVVKGSTELLDNIENFENRIKKFVNIYGIVLIIFSMIILVCSTYIVYKSGLTAIDVATTATCILVGVGGWAALKTWQISFIFNLRQERRTMTLQQMISHQQSNIYQNSKKILRDHFPQSVNSVEITPLPLISAMGEDTANNNNLTEAQIEEIENAFEGIMNSYEQLAAAIIEGYVDESYLRETIRGQVVRVCGLLSNNIRAANKESSKTYEHIIEIYELWHDTDLDGTKCTLKG